MKIALVHNFYQILGGEDSIFRNEKQLLRSHGNEVVEFTKHNKEIENYRVKGKIQLALGTVYNSQVKKEFNEFIERERPQIVHFYNTFPLISPSAYQVCKQHKIPAVQTLLNYRLLCPKALFYREGKVCEDCLGKTIPINGVINSCYRKSILQTGVVAASLAFHNICKTLQKQVSAFITLNEFAKMKFVKGGLPENRIYVKPSFTYGSTEWNSENGKFALFVGRLSEEKGIKNLIDSWREIRDSLPLKIAGNGPLSNIVKTHSNDFSGTDWLGEKSKKEVLRLMDEAYLLVFPSECYEGGPMVIVEAFSRGLPVISSNIGSMTYLVKHKINGLHFRAGNSEKLVNQIKWAIRHPKEIKRMRFNARNEYETNHTPEKNYQILMDIYESAAREV